MTKWRKLIVGVAGWGESTLWRNGWENPDVAGLVVNECFDDGFKGYTVTHCRSGKRLGDARTRGIFRKRSTAQQCAEDLASLWNYDVPAEEYKRHRTVRLWTRAIIDEALEREDAFYSRLSGNTVLDERGNRR